MTACNFKQRRGRSNDLLFGGIFSPYLILTAAADTGFAFCASEADGHQAEITPNKPVPVFKYGKLEKPRL